MKHTNDYDEQYYAELQAQEEETEEQQRFFEEEQRQAEQRHNEQCIQDLKRVYISSSWDDGMKRYAESWHCSECELWIENSIDLDDFLYLKNKGVEVRYG